MDTIASIATPQGRGGISVIRISGERALEAVSSIFVSKRKLIPNYMTYGKISNKGKELDEVMVCYMKAPYSYTREDVIEIYCHGNSLIANAILQILLERGVRLAAHGEFTKRAFINGRIDLTQAEAISDLISANSAKGIECSLQNLNGYLKDKVKDLKQVILDTLSHINVVCDYPEEVEDFVFNRDALNKLVKDLDILISAYDTGKKIKEGIKVAIVGRPNVGKSSLMNRLLKNDRAIVTNIPGTTRDVLEEIIYIEGFPVVLLDTAGIRETKDKIEKIGISLSKRSIAEADIILFVLDSSNGYTKEDNEIYQSIKDKPHINIFNKSDLNNNTKKINLNKEIENNTFPIIGTYFSAKKGEISIIEKEILKLGLNRDISNNNENLFITNIRHRDLFFKVQEHVNSFLDSDDPIDVTSSHLIAALESLGEIIGEISNEDLLDNIFSNFCVGK